MRGNGLLNAIVIDQTQLNQEKTAWHLCLLMKKNGLLAKPTHGNIIRLAPPLCIKKSEIKRSLLIIGKSLDEIQQIDLSKINKLDF